MTGGLWTAGYGLPRGTAELSTGITERETVVRNHGNMCYARNWREKPRSREFTVSVIRVSFREQQEQQQQNKQTRAFAF